MTLVEDTFYEHDDHGRVELLRLTDKYVAFEICMSERLEVEKRSEFDAATEPAPMTIEAPATKLSADTPEPK